MSLYGNKSTLKPGDEIVLSDMTGKKYAMTISRGDVFLNGRGEHYWVSNDSDSDRVYLRKPPTSEMSVGEAVFGSTDELFTTLNSGEYYIG